MKCIELEKNRERKLTSIIRKKEKLFSLFLSLSLLSRPLVDFFSPVFICKWRLGVILVC